MPFFLTGVSGKALQWSSYLSERCFSVTLGSLSSDPAPLICGLPQGSVLGLTLFAVYILPLGHFISSFPGVTYQCYADAIQLHFSFGPFPLVLTRRGSTRLHFGGFPPDHSTSSALLFFVPTCLGFYPGWIRPKIRHHAAGHWLAREQRHGWALKAIPPHHI